MNLDSSGVIDRSWIARRSDEDLTRLIALASSELRRRGSTLTGRAEAPVGPVEFVEVNDIPLEDYVTVPSQSAGSLLSKSRTWHIVLISSDSRHRPMALKLVGDAVIGRSTEEAAADIDLNPFDPAVYGVSRIHAMLRPSVDRLLLNDLGSTNGTKLNGDRLEMNQAATVTDGSVITLGKLHLKVVIMRRPEDSVG